MTTSETQQSMSGERDFQRTNASAKRVAIVQSSYIPWKGYFDLIASVDEFILFDDVQYTRRDWRNRNKIKTHTGLHWLTIPVQVKGNFYIPINEVKVADRGWAKQHWETLRHAYASAPCFRAASEEIADLYGQAGELERLSEINYLFIRYICSKLGITTRLSWSTDYRTRAARNSELSEVEALVAKNNQIIQLCQAIQGKCYISGPAAKSYAREELFNAAGISLEWMTYQPYPEYRQIHGEFVHEVSILDLIFNVGEEATRFFRKLN